MIARRCYCLHCGDRIDPRNYAEHRGGCLCLPCWEDYNREIPATEGEDVWL